MPYSPVEDVPDIETSRMDVRKRDRQMVSVIDATRFALRHRHNLRKKTNQESSLIFILRSQLLLYKTTHRSIRIILARAYRKEDWSLVPDASSLLREQVEKIYIIALFLDNPARWITRYSRSGWRTDYERYLLEMEEYGEIERHQEFLKRDFPEYLEKTRRPRVGRKTELVVSDFAKRALTHKWNNPSDERPAWFLNSQKGKKQKVGRLRDYIREYFEFPTPGRAIRMIGNRSLKGFLVRWHKEYSSVCQYSHVAFGKMLIPTMSDEFKDMYSGQKTESNARKLAERTVFMSHIAAATSCALVANSLKDSYGAKTELKNLWRELYESSLPAKALWNMYIKNILR